jgi:hypothetical protein
MWEANNWLEGRRASQAQELSKQKKKNSIVNYYVMSSIFNFIVNIYNS